MCLEYRCNKFPKNAVSLLQLAWKEPCQLLSRMRNLETGRRGSFVWWGAQEIGKISRDSFPSPEVDRYLKHNDFLALRRKEMLYKKWFESVSRPLLQKIQDKVDNQSSEEIEERKRKQFSLYLNYCNKKGSAFLESYSPSCYDPFFLKTYSHFILWKWSCSTCFQFPTGKIYSCKELNELHKTELPLLPLSRQLMNPVEWLKIPPGYIESEIRQKRLQNYIRESSFFFMASVHHTYGVLCLRSADDREIDS
uniref:Protein FAM228B n=1 Tax=Varanus komodoensis TaxID=61221 RepID=A0A8D2IUH0_VARKO